MESHGITTSELEVALRGSYTAPTDPDYPTAGPADGKPTPHDGAASITTGELEAALAGLYSAPRLDEAA